MANEEKAREIIDSYGNKITVGRYFNNFVQDEYVSSENAVELLTQMADWKDKQLKEYLEKKRDKWQSAYEETQDSDYYAVYNTLAEIINELFKEDEK